MRTVTRGAGMRARGYRGTPAGGRIAGWRAAAGSPRRALPHDAIDHGLDARTSLRLRRADYALAGPPRR